MAYESDGSARVKLTIQYPVEKAPAEAGRFRTFGPAPASVITRAAQRKIVRPTRTRAALTVDIIELAKIFGARCGYASHWGPADVRSAVNEWSEPHAQVLGEARRG